MKIEENQKLGLASAKPPDPASSDRGREQQVAKAQQIARTVTGSRSDESAARRLFQVQQGLSWPRVGEDDALITALTAIAEMKPGNALESMLTVQMIALHDASLLFMTRGVREERCQEVIDSNLTLSTRCMRLFLEQVEALQRLQGKTGQQKVVVEHVNVHEGGQAIVGAVSVPAKEEGG